MSSTRLSAPPRIKVLEALGALGDGRVEVVDEKRCRVRSSEGDRVYNVYVDVDRGLAFSTDNGTVYRNYVGYPIVSCLMAKGIIPFDPELAEKLKEIRWKTLNENYKNYALVEQHVRRLLALRGGSIDRLDSFVNEVMRRLRELTFFKLPAPPLE